MLPEICKTFWNDSFIDPFEKTDQQKGIPTPLFELPFDEINLIELPNPQDLKYGSFDDEEVNAVLKLDESGFFLTYAASIGKVT